jgi:AcrR family transcriptional regulator
VTTGPTTRPPTPAATPAAAQDGTPARIVDAAARLLAEGGREAVTTRAVAAAAGAQPPAIYRAFGDMRGLLDAVAADGFDRYLASKTAQPPTGDPVDDLRAGWDLHQQFARENPAHYVLMYAPGEQGGSAQAADRALDILRGLVRRVAAAGRLRGSVEGAVALVHATGMGVALHGMTTHDSGEALAEHAVRAREAVVAAITVDGEVAERPDPRGAVAARAEELRAALVSADGAAPLSPGERALLDELLVRLAQP